jgi:large subunit ribosomal protein L33
MVERRIPNPQVGGSIPSGLVFMRIVIALECKGCGRRNYKTRKDKDKKEKLSLMKYCKWCKKHTEHVERKA